MKSGLGGNTDPRVSLASDDTGNVSTVAAGVERIFIGRLRTAGRV